MGKFKVGDYGLGLTGKDESTYSSVVNNSWLESMKGHLGLDREEKAETSETSQNEQVESRFESVKEYASKAIMHINRLFGDEIDPYPLSIKKAMEALDIKESSESAQRLESLDKEFAAQTEAIKNEIETIGNTEPVGGNETSGSRSAQSGTAEAVSAETQASIKNQEATFTDKAGNKQPKYSASWSKDGKEFQIPSEAWQKHQEEEKREQEKLRLAKELAAQRKALEEELAAQRKALEEEEARAETSSLDPETNLFEENHNKDPKVSESELRTEELPNNPETKEKLLEDKVFEQGGFYVLTSLPKEYSQTGYSGFGTLWDKNRVDTPSDSKQKFFFDNEDKVLQLGATELVKLEPYYVPEYKNEEITEKPPGIFGFFKKPVIKKKSFYTGSRQAKASEIINGGGDENAFSLVYKVNDTQLPREAQYQDYSHRAGQQLVMEIVLPESVAKKTIEQIKQDPKFIRRLVEKCVIEKMGITKEVWEKGDSHTNGIPLRPPYEKWDKALNNNTKVYVMDGDQFDEKSFYKI